MLLGKIKSFLLFNGLEAMSFKVIQKDINEQNRKIESITFLVITLLLFSLLGLSWFFGVNAEEKTIYILSAAATPVAMVIADLMKNIFKNASCGQYLVVFIAFTCGIFDGIASPNRLAVMPVVLFVILPILFINRPIITIVQFFLYLVLFIGACMRFKASDVYPIDAVDGIAAYVFGVAIACFIHHFQCLYLSERGYSTDKDIDVFTGLKNRHAYEMEISSLLEEKVDFINLTCIRVKLMNLDEVDDGHAKSYEAKRFIADSIIKLFDTELSFHNKDDEFTILTIGHSAEDDRNRLYQLIQAAEWFNRYLVISFTKSERCRSIVSLIEESDRKLALAEERFIELTEREFNAKTVQTI